MEDIKWKNDPIKFKENGKITVIIKPQILRDAWQTRKPNQTIDERITELIIKGREVEKAEEAKLMHEIFVRKEDVKEGNQE
jgi:hypothetical protein